MKRWFVMALLCLGVACRGDVERGYASWTAGDVPEALEIWKAEAESGRGSAATWYNLGNAWYAQSDVPRAIAAWRTARGLHPRLGDAAHNLALARGQLKGLPEPVPHSVRWAEAVTPGELAVLGSLPGFAASVLAFLRFRRGRPPMNRVVAALSVLATWISLIALSGWRDQALHPVAVVVDRAAALREAPLPEARVVSELPVGSEVQVEKIWGDFAHIRAGDGRAGFVALSGMVLAVPDAR